MTQKLVIDATDGTLGRIAAFAAKQALLGKEIAIVNCNDVLITGRPRTTINDYKQAKARGGSSQKGPNFPKSPEKIMKRTIRGMLSHRQSRGKTAFKKIMCYNSFPEEFQSLEKISLKRELKTKAIKLSNLSREL